MKILLIALLIAFVIATVLLMAAVVAVHKAGKYMEYFWRQL